MITNKKATKAQRMLPNGSQGLLQFIPLVLLIAGCNVKGVQTPLAEKEQLQKQFDAYTDTIPGSNINFEMVAIPEGKFLMGSPNSEHGRDADEAPSVARRCNASRPMSLGPTPSSGDSRPISTK